MRSLVALLIIMLLFSTFTFSVYDEPYQEYDAEYIARFYIEQAAKEFNENPAVIYAIAKLESEGTFNPNLVCYNRHSKDRGIMQINSIYEQQFRKDCENYRNRTFIPYSPFYTGDNITLGTYIFWTTKFYKPQCTLAERLTIYNGGYGYLLKYGINHDYVRLIMKYKEQY